MKKTFQHLKDFHMTTSTSTIFLKILRNIIKKIKANLFIIAIEGLGQQLHPMGLIHFMSDISVIDQLLIEKEAKN